MKRKLLIIFGVIFIFGMIFSSCEKEESLQPNKPTKEIFKTGRDYIVSTFFDYADEHRDGSHPEAYNAIIDTSYQEFIKIYEENILDELDDLTADVNHEFRYGKNIDSASEAYDEINPGFYPEFYDFCPGFCEDLHILIRHYVIEVVNGNPEWADGTANEYHRQKILNFLNTVDPNNEWNMTYGSIMKHKMAEYVVNGRED
jgi:hypothetical protein